MSTPELSFEYVREQIVGIDSAVETPFGRRRMVYCDYTAAGRVLLFVERYLLGLQRIYATCCSGSRPAATWRHGRRMGGRGTSRPR